MSEWRQKDPNELTPTSTQKENSNENDQNDQILQDFQVFHLAKYQNKSWRLPLRCQGSWCDASTPYSLFLS